MDSEISEVSSEVLKQTLTVAIVKICQDLLKFKEFVHITGQLSFYFDNKEVSKMYKCGRRDAFENQGTVLDLCALTVA